MSYFSVLEWFSVLVRNPISASRWRAQIKSLPASIPFVLLTARRVEQPPAAAQLQPWTRCWEGRKLTSGVPLYRCCQTHRWQPVQSRCSKKLYLHIHAYMCIHRRWLSLAPRRLHVWSFCHYPVPFPVCHFTVKHSRCSATQTGLFRYYICINERKNQLLWATSKCKLNCTYSRTRSTAAGAPCSYFAGIKKSLSQFVLISC